MGKALSATQAVYQRGLADIAPADECELGETRFWLLGDVCASACKCGLLYYHYWS